MSEKNGKKIGAGKRIGIALGIVLVVVVVLLLGVRLAFRIPCGAFYRGAQAEFTIPGLSDGYVPQGLCYDEASGRYLTCGYVPGDASRVYAIDEQGNAVGTTLRCADGTAYTGHTGGIAVNGEYAYITGSDGCDVFLLRDLLVGGEAVQVGAFATGNDPAYCHIEDGMLYVGTFYRAGNYETPDWERMTTPAGDENPAVMLVFPLSETAPYGVAEAPVKAYSTPGLVQGMCFDGAGRLVLSTSYGLAFSQLYVYQPEKTVPGSSYSVGEFTVPLYFLDSESLVETVQAPPMSEELLFHNGRVYVMTESASNKYIFGKLTGGEKIYAYQFAE